MTQEIEKKLSGRPVDLERLSHEPLLRFTLKGKEERGQHVLEKPPPATAKAGRAVLPSGASAEDAFRVSLKHCLRHIAQITPAVGQARDVEGLHQLRVGLRRLRAVLEVFGKEFESKTFEKLRERAKAFGKIFGETRDLDVFAAELLPQVEAAAPGQAGLEELREHLEAARKESWSRCASFASSEEFRQFLLDLAEAAETRIWRQGAGPEQIATFMRPAKELAREALATRDRKARKRARHLAELDSQQRHRLRIALKKLRYTAEFFAPLFAQKHVAKYLKTISATQDVFGAMNDAATASHILGTIVERSVSGENAALREGAAFVDGWHRARIEPAWREAKARWKRLEKSKPFWAK